MQPALDSVPCMTGKTIKGNRAITKQYQLLLIPDIKLFEATIASKSSQ